MNAADTSASSAMADCTPETVVSRSRTTAEMETFMSEVSTTSTNIAIASRRGSKRLRTGGLAVSGGSVAIWESWPHQVPCCSSAVSEAPAERSWLVEAAWTERVRGERGREVQVDGLLRRPGP